MSSLDFVGTDAKKLKKFEIIFFYAKFAVLNFRASRVYILCEQSITAGELVCFDFHVIFLNSEGLSTQADF